MAFNAGHVKRVPGDLVRCQHSFYCDQPLALGASDTYDEALPTSPVGTVRKLEPLGYAGCAYYAQAILDRRVALRDEHGLSRSRTREYRSVNS